jgi:hypothetical protein
MELGGARHFVREVGASVYHRLASVIQSVPAATSLFRGEVVRVAGAMI